MPVNVQYLASRIRAARLRLGLNQDEAAQRTGLKFRTYGAYERGEIQSPSLENVQSIAHGLEAPELLEIMSEEATEERRGADTSRRAIVPAANGDDVSSLFGEEMELVVYKDVHPAAAGDRSVIYYEEDKEILYVPKGFVLKLLGFAPPRSIGVCFIDGDSMSPTLEDGDMVLYRPEAQLDGGGVYMLLLDGALVAKRVQKIPGGGYHIISDNKFHGYKDAMLVPGDGAYSESLVNPETGRPVDMRVVGRIIWPRRSTDKLHIKQVTALIQGLMTGAPPNVPGL